MIWEHMTVIVIYFTDSSLPVKDFSLNVSGVCDASLKFTNTAVKWPGNAQDSRIFNESRLCEALEGGRQLQSAQKT